MPTYNVKALLRNARFFSYNDLYAESQIVAHTQVSLNLLQACTYTVGFFIYEN